jgi:hypothetical protein
VTANELRLMELVADACMMSMSVMAGLFPAHDDEYLGKRNQIEAALSAVKRESTAPVPDPVAKTTPHPASREDCRMRFRVEERSGIVAVHDTAHVEYQKTPGSHADDPWTVCSWIGEYDKQEGHWNVDRRWIDKAHAACQLLNASQPGVPVTLPLWALIAAGNRLALYTSHDDACAANITSGGVCDCGYRAMFDAWRAARDAAREGGAS